MNIEVRSNAPIDHLEVVWPLSKDHYLTIPPLPLPVTANPRLLVPRDQMYLTCRQFFAGHAGLQWWTARQLAVQLCEAESDRSLAVIGLALIALFRDKLVDRRFSTGGRYCTGARPYEYRWREPSASKG